MILISMCVWTPGPTCYVAKGCSPARATCRGDYSRVAGAMAAFRRASSSSRASPRPYRSYPQ